MTGRVIALALLAVLGACGAQKSVPPPPEYHGFGAEQRVAIRGYAGDAMEPFITRDGRYLFFNNRNDPRIDTNLHYAERVDDLTFDYRGELQGANSPVLDAVPSMDRDGNLYFISTRSYAQTLSTLYRGRFRAGASATLAVASAVAGAARPGLASSAPRSNGEEPPTRHHEIRDAHRKTRSLRTRVNAKDGTASCDGWARAGSGSAR